MTSLAGNTKELRDLGYISWSDPLAYLEDPTSKVFQKTVRQEEAEFQRQLKRVSITPWKELYSTLDTAYPLSPDYAHVRIPWIYDTVLAIQKRPTSPNYAAWILHGAKVLWHETALTSVSYSVDGLFCTVQDIGKGSELLQLEVYELDSSRKMKECWKRSPVGPTTGFFEDTLIYLGVDVGGLRYNSVQSAIAKTGKSVKQLYHEKDDKIQLELLTPHRQSHVFIRGSNSMKHWIGIVEDEKIRIYAHGMGTMLPVSDSIRLENECVRVGSKEIRFPPNEFGLSGTLGPEGILYITTISYGKTSLWKLEKDRLERMGPKPTHPREIHFLEGPTVHILIRCPYEADRIVRVEDGRTVLSFPTPLSLRLVKSGIRKGVPYTVVRSTSSRTLRGLLVESYGAYGLCSRRSYPIRWLPWLAAGWAIAVIAPRGSRDHGDAWWDGARGALKKHHTFEDTAIGIRSAQLCTGVKASNTVLYGRSAGGWAAAMTGQDHPELLGAIYAEVPYVDILRTTTNVALPLTTMEYEEFGDPLHHPDHFTAIAKITPMITIPSALEGIDMPFVLARTGLYDKQVATYEVLKWAIRLRTAGWNVAVGIDTKGGHFAAADAAAFPREAGEGSSSKSSGPAAGLTAAAQQWAEDAALLDSLVGYTPPRHHSTVRHPRSTSAR